MCRRKLNYGIQLGRLTQSLKSLMKGTVNKQEIQFMDDSKV